VRGLGLAAHRHLLNCAVSDQHDADHFAPSPRGAAAAAVSYDSRMDEPTIELYMTAAPHTIGPDQPLSAAHDLMRAHAIRHLPVLDGDALVGLVSLGDLHLLETLDEVDPREATVLEAMSEKPYAVSPREPLRQVAAEMAARKISSAVVVENERVVGIFTAVDGLRGLSLLLAQVSAAMR
jgi:acetoin utilization protein AcuB